MARVFIDGVLQTDGAHRYTFTKSANSGDLTLPFASSNEFPHFTYNNELYIFYSNNPNYVLYKLTNGFRWEIVLSISNSNNSMFYCLGVYGDCAYFAEAFTTSTTNDGTANLHMFKFDLTYNNSSVNYAELVSNNSNSIEFAESVSFNFNPNVGINKIISNSNNGKVYWLHEVEGRLAPFIMLNLSQINQNQEITYINFDKLLEIEKAHYVIYNNKLRLISYHNGYGDHDDNTDTWTYQNTRSHIGTGATNGSDFLKLYIFIDSQGREHQVGTFAEANDHNGTDFIFDPATGDFVDTFVAQLPVNNNFACVGEANGYFYYMGGTTAYGNSTPSNHCYRVPTTKTTGGSSMYYASDFESSVDIYNSTKEAIS